MKVFLVLLLAHVIADFITQSKQMIQQKQKFSRPYFSEGILYHCIHHLGISFVLCILFLEWNDTFLFIIPLISIVHYFIDLVKIKMEDHVSVHRLRKQYREQTWYQLCLQRKTLLFIGDQLAHLISLYMILFLFGYHFSNNEFINLFSPEIYETDAVMRYLVLLLLFVLVTYPSAHFISILMNDLEGKKVENEIAASLTSETEQMRDLESHVQGLHTDLIITETFQDEKEKYSMQVQYHKFYNTNENPRGRYIGMLERILIIIFIVSNLIQGLALIIAMKTLTRFKQFEDKSFAEYYLIGTLLSLTIGIIFAFMIKKIW